MTTFLAPPPAASLADRALFFAAGAHITQKRKYDGSPYVSHCISVAEFLRRNTEHAPIEAIAAAFLHDVVEDCGVTPDQLLNEFGPLVAELVMEVTDVSILPEHKGKNRRTRKELDREHLSRASYWGANIKLCDLIDNTSSIVENDPDFARVYLKEKVAVLDSLNEYDDCLMAFARAKIKKGEFKVAEDQRLRIVRAAIKEEKDAKEARADARIGYPGAGTIA